MNLSLFQSPGTIVFLDDDPGYLDMLALVLPQDWHIRFFLRPQSCIHHLILETNAWENDLANQQQILTRWRELGTPLIPQILDYWSTTERYALSRICVVDYSMPAMNGLQALERLEDWHGARILLTGQADEQIAVKAFNYGLIEQFIPKQTPDISQRLIEAIQRLQMVASSRQPPLWRATLSQRQYTLLRSPSISAELSAFVSKRWIEHVVIGHPFGILGRDADGNVGWLQLEPASGLDELAELAEAEGLSSQSIDDIQAGRKLVNLELRQSLNRSAAPELSTAFSIGIDEPMLGAVFAVETPAGQAHKISYNQWSAQQAERAVTS